MTNTLYAVTNHQGQLLWVAVHEPDTPYFWVYNWETSKFHRNRPLWNEHFRNLTNTYTPITPQEAHNLITTTPPRPLPKKFSDQEFWDAQTRTLTELTP